MADATTKKPGPVHGTAGEAADRARDKIDAGKTGDKVKAFDPAMSPLGTDEEAGRPHDEDGLRIAREAGSRPPGRKT
jgi:hypothetical protein